jgi:hypothetical protein
VTELNAEHARRAIVEHTRRLAESAAAAGPDAAVPTTPGWTITDPVLRHGGFAALAGRAPEELIRWEADYGWTRRGYGQVAERETPLAVPLARLLTTPDMWRTFAESIALADGYRESAEWRADLRDCARRGMRARARGRRRRAPTARNSPRPRRSPHVGNLRPPEDR